VVRWEWAGDHAAVEQPIIALFPPQIGGETIRRFVEWHYAATQYEPRDAGMVDVETENEPLSSAIHADRVCVGRRTRQMVPWQGAIVCGHNPYILARIARNVHMVRRSEYMPGELVWEDLPRPTHDLRRPPDG
jgi:hypothetical protein